MTRKEEVISQFEVLSRNLLGGAESHGRPHIQYIVSRPKFEMSTFGVQARMVTARASVSCLGHTDR
jgi:hypothetical protein